MPIKIGFDDKDQKDSEELEELQEEIDKKVIENLKERYDKFHLKKEREEQFKSRYTTVVVHNFGDLYHKSEEERESENEFYDSFKKIQKYKHKYRKLDEFVDAMRAHLNVLDDVANHQYIYKPNKFKKLFLNKKIEIVGLRLPVYTGKDKKRISYDYLAEFIMGNEPSENIMPKKKTPEEEFGLVENEDKPEDVLPKDMLEKLKNDIDKDDSIIPEAPVIDYKDIDKHNPNQLVLDKKKKAKRFIKEYPDVNYELNKLRKEQRSLSRAASASAFIFDMSESEIDELDRYENDKVQVLGKLPKFKGDIMNDHDYYKYLDKLDEYADTMIYENYQGRHMNQEEIRQTKIKADLDEGGWNIMALYNNKDEAKEMKKMKKKAKKKEETLRKKIAMIQNKQKSFESSNSYSDYMEKKKQKKRKLGKGKEKKKKEKRERDLDEFLLNVNGDTEHDTFKEYEDDVLDFTWKEDNDGKD